jgi:hypothetical protein
VQIETVARVPGWAGREIRIEPITAGLTNGDRRQWWTDVDQAR